MKKTHNPLKPREHKTNTNISLTKLLKNNTGISIYHNKLVKCDSRYWSRI